MRLPSAMTAAGVAGFIKIGPGSKPDRRSMRQGREKRCNGSTGFFVCKLLAWNFSKAT
jgi:hypothetical protein